MSHNRLVLYHQEEVFLSRFGTYLEKKTNGAMRCICFQEEGAFRSYVDQYGASLLIVQEGPAVRLAESTGLPFLVFTERSEGSKENHLPIYRSMDRQIRQIRRVWKETAPSPAALPHSRVFGFYTPVHGAGQSVSAILMGLHLAEEQPALLVNLERVSGLKQILSMGEGGLSDLLYYARVQGDPLSHLAELTEYYGSLAFLPPVRDEEDLKEMSPRDWIFLLNQMKECSLYRYILLDLGDGAYGSEDLLPLCDRIYVALREDRLSQCKLQEWQETLRRKQGEEILKRIRPYRLPQESPSDWVDYRELRLMPWGRSLKALVEAEL